MLQHRDGGRRLLYSSVFCLLHCPAQSLAHFAFFSVLPCLPTVPCVPVPAFASACCQWHPVLCTLKSRIEENTGHTFNSLLCNLYRDEKDSVDWHSDDEPSLGSCPVIVSLSFGATRTFEMRKKPPPVSILCLTHIFLPYLLIGEEPRPPKSRPFWD